MATRINLRTKTSVGSVSPADLERRELIFGEAQSSIFLKNTSDTLLRFISVNDAGTSSNTTWSSEQIATAIAGGAVPSSSIIDWDDRFADDFDARFRNASTTTTDDLNEGISNFYFTDSRARSAIVPTNSTSINFDYNTSTGVLNSYVAVDNLTLENDAVNGVQLKDDGISASKLASNINAIPIGFNADKVDSCDVNDGETSTNYLWTASKIIEYVSNTLDGLDWQDSVLTRDLSIPPLSPDEGDRHIIGSLTANVGQSYNATSTIVVTGDVTSAIVPGTIIKLKGPQNETFEVLSATFATTDTSIVVDGVVDDNVSGVVHYAQADWNAYGPDQIVEYIQSTWQLISTSTANPNVGWCSYVEGIGYEVVYNGTSWVSKASGTIHTALSGLQGGTTDEYYHLTETQWNQSVLIYSEQLPNLVICSPDGINGNATFRSLVPADMPSYPASQLTEFDEYVMDAVGVAVNGVSHNNIDVNYDDTQGTLRFNVNVATDTSIGLASFEFDDFDMNAGHVQIRTQGIVPDHLHPTVNTDAISEGTSRFYFTNERVWDSLGSTNTDSVNMSFDDTIGVMSADVRVDDITLEIDAVNHYVKIKSVDGGTF